MESETSSSKPPPLRWRHIIINTRGSWLHGDPRGFRDRQHRIHSSGDYKHPPPPAEHAGLHLYMLSRSAPPVEIPPDLRQAVLDALLQRLRHERYTVIAGSVGATHAHLLVKLPDDVKAARQIIGRCKRAACEAVKGRMKGPLWSAGGLYAIVRNRAHQLAVYQYIVQGQEDGAVSWGIGR